MSALLKPALATTPQAVIVYPESDGKPMADNSKQLRWIVVLFDNLSALFRAVADVLVGANQFWYPREGEGEEPQAPDVYVVCGRPKGDRSSYQQWVEDDVPMTVVIEVLSPGNTVEEMAKKFAFYDDYGVEEYYIYNPETNYLQAFVRRGEALVRVRKVHGYVSPRLGIRFDLSGPEMAVFYPDGRRFLTFEQLEEARVQEKQRADQEKQRADQEKQRADQEKQRADQEKQRADQEKQRADQEKQRAARMAELGRKARRGQASEEERQELDRLEDQAAPPGTP